MTSKLKYKGYLSFFLQIILSFVEILFAYVVFAILNVITKTNQDILFINTKNLSLLILYLLIFIIFIAIIRITVSKLVNSFAFGACKEICNMFYDAIVNLDYQEIVSTNSSQYITTITQRIFRVSFFFKGAMEIICSSLIFCFLFFSSIFFLNISVINMIIFLILLISLSYFTYYFLKKKTKLLSHRYNNELSNINILLRDTNTFIREILLNKHFNIFKNNFYLSTLNLFNTESKMAFISILPRYLLEAIVMIIGSLLLLIFSSNENFLVNMGFLFFIFLRLFPHLSIINSNIISFRANLEVLNFTSNLFNSFRQKKNILICENQSNIFREKFFSLKIENLEFKYKDNLIFKKLNFNIKNNQLLAVTGSSGSGKTTLLNIISGFLKPEHGNIFYNDKKVQSLKSNIWQNKIAYVGQNIPIFDKSLIYNLTLDENFNFEKNKNKLKKVLNLALIDWIKDHDELYAKVGEGGSLLSGGQKQRLALARALYLDNKEILILDEITSSLDFKNEEKLVSNFKSLKSEYTIISVTHRKAILEIADHIIDLA